MLLKSIVLETLYSKYSAPLWLSNSPLFVHFSTLAAWMVGPFPRRHGDRVCIQFESCFDVTRGFSSSPASQCQTLKTLLIDSAESGQRAAQKHFCGSSWGGNRPYRLMPPAPLHCSGQDGESGWKKESLRCSTFDFKTPSLLESEKILRSCVIVVCWTFCKHIEDTKSHLVGCELVFLLPIFY